MEEAWKRGGWNSEKQNGKDKVMSVALNLAQ